MANINKIKVDGFGSFQNKKAKEGNLIGTFKTLQESITACLDENLEILIKNYILSSHSVEKIKTLFTNNPLLQMNNAFLVHNDFADWNLLTDSDTITGVVDWDECVGGHPVQDITCWSSLFNPERINTFLKGYFSQTEKCDNFDALFQLFRLQYTISKMALRIKKYTYEPTPFLKSLLDEGKRHLKELSYIYNLNID